MKRILAAGATLASLAGCIDMKQDLTVRTDGQATFAIELSVEAAIIAMQKEGAADFCADKGEPPEGITVEYVRSTERGDVICTITASGPIDRLAEIMEGNSLLPSAPDGQASPDAPRMVIVKDGDNYRFDVAIKFNKPESPKEGTPDLSQMMLAMTAGRSLSWSVTAPSIVETSGKLSEDGKTATHSIPLAMMMSGEYPEARFSTTFSTRSGNGLMDWVGGLFGGQP